MSVVRNVIFGFSLSLVPVSFNVEIDDAKMIGFESLLKITQASADSFESPDETFQLLIDKANAKCRRSQKCPKNPLRYSSVYRYVASGKMLKPVAALAVLKRLQLIALEQANIWSDTILEGEFEADHRTRLDGVETVLFKDRSVGYRISYSEKAWYLAACSADLNPGLPVRSYEGCQEGRIHERTFVSKDLKTWFRDENHLADFTPIE